MAGKKNPKKEFIRKLSVYTSLLAVAALAALAGWLANANPLWAGILIGLCPGAALGFVAGIAAVVVFVADSPQEFVDRVSPHSTEK